MDDVRLPEHPDLDERLDEGVKETFPASDPVAVQGDSETSWQRKRKRRR